METVIDLGELHSRDVQILSGKQRGIEAREHFHLDELDDAEGSVVVRVPVRLLTSSFILGMFSHSVRHLGTVDRFFEKYQFDASESIVSRVRRYADFSLSDNTALTDNASQSKDS